jgi:hypothetical protein
MRFTFRLLAAVAVVALSGVVASANPIIIDNFNQYNVPAGSGPTFSGWNSTSTIHGPAGNHVLNSPGTRNILETGLSTSNVRGGTRATTLTAATIGSGSVPFEGIFENNAASQKVFSLNQTNATNGSVKFEYSFVGNPLNLLGTAGFALDFVFLEAGNMTLVIDLLDGGTSTSTQTLNVPVTVTGTTTVFIPLSSFSSGANLANITGIRLLVDPAVSQDFGIDNFVVVVPEPASLAVFGVLALGGLAVARRKLLARRGVASA